MAVENQETEKDWMLQAYIDDRRLEEETVAETETEETVAKTETQETVEETQPLGATGASGVVGNPGIQLDAEPETVAEVAKVLPEPEFKSDKDRWIYEKIKAGEDKEVYEKLRDKYEYESYNEEKKMLSFLAVKYPFLDEEELRFKAEDEYGIGKQEIDEDDLTEEEKRANKKQGIERKGLLSEADRYFTDKAETIELPTLANPLDADEDYKSYKERVKADEAARIESEKQVSELNKQIENTAKSLNQIGVEVKIESIDDGEFALNVQFDFDDKKKTQLADFAKVYTPTQAQIEARTDQNGEFDMKGYMTDLANQLFSKQIMKAAIKQAIVKDRESFEARELKNSTLNNREVQQQTSTDVDLYSQLMAF